MTRYPSFESRALALVLCALPLAGCGTSSGSGPDASQTAAYAGIAPDETIKITGTEPFWNGEIADGQMQYRTMENQDGWTFPVERFAGNNGVSFTGQIEGETIDVAITPGACSDGMSDRTYTFVATVVMGGETRSGCAYTDRQGFTGPEAP